MFIITWANANTILLMKVLKVLLTADKRTCVQVYIITAKQLTMKLVYKSYTWLVKMSQSSFKAGGPVYSGKTLGREGFVVVTGLRDHLIYLKVL